VVHPGRAGERLQISRVERNLVFRDGRGERVISGPGPFWIRTDDRSRPVLLGEAEYAGHFVVQASPGKGFNVINVIDLETYLRGVVPSEIGHAGDYLEAAKAQAVAARTYVLSHLGQFPREGYDLESGTNDQVYGPLSRRHPDSDRAVAATRGEVLQHDGSMVIVRYASTCGGEIADVSESFEREKIPYLRAHRDEMGGKVACRTSKYYRWEVTWSGQDLWRILSVGIPRVTGKPWKGRQLRDISVGKRGKSGRALELRVRTDEADYTVEKGAIRRLLERPEGGPLYSTHFELEATRSGDTAVKLTARGRGWGHGVGMCQWGAMQLSTEGHDYRTILQHYYPGTKLERVY
jgi:stage II sporulation protein D